MEFVYLDQVDENGNYYINPSVPDKDDLKNIQAWRVAVMQGDDGKTYQVRGYSGWYFQASSSTSDIDINSTPSAEDNVLEMGGRSKWYDFVMWWANKPKDDPDYPDPPYGNGAKFYGLDHLFMGLAEFGGHNFTGQGFDPSTGQPIISRYPGPIRMSHLYGPYGDHTDHKIYHTMKFEYSGGCEAILAGKAPTIENWGDLGSILSSSGKTKFNAGTDTLLVIDGQRGIRIRVNGWHAHIGDHIQKNSASADPNHGWGALMQWDIPFSYYYADLETSEINSVSSFSIRAFHHWWLAKWCEKYPEKMNRYNIQARGSLWLYPEVAAGSPAPNVFADPYKVITDSTHLALPDDICFSKARVDKTVHEPARPPWIPLATYADSMAIDFSFKYPSDRWRYAKIDLFSDNTHIGSVTIKFYQDGKRTYGLSALRWKIMTGGGGFPAGDGGVDPEERGNPDHSDNSAIMVCLPFGPRDKSVLPTCGVVITKKGFVGKPYSFVPWSHLNTQNIGNIMGGGNGVESVIIDWGDGKADAATLNTSIDHMYENAGIYTVTVVVRYVPTDGRQPDSSRTYITVEAE